MSEVPIRIHRCGCPVFLNYRLHRYPCGLVGHIDDDTPTPLAHPTQRDQGDDA